MSKEHGEGGSGGRREGGEREKGAREREGGFGHVSCETMCLCGRCKEERGVGDVFWITSQPVS